MKKRRKFNFYVELKEDLDRVADEYSIMQGKEITNPFMTEEA